MTVSAASNCCDTSCPEPVDQVTIVNNTLDPDNALSLTVANVGGGSGTTTASFQIIDSAAAAVSAVARINWWLVDANDRAAVKSAIVPSTPGVNEDFVITSSAGLATLAMLHTGALDEWYIVAELLNILYIAGPINLGT